MGSERDRVICITLSEAEYRAFVAVQPQPVLWLRERILEETRTLGTEGRETESRQVA